MPAGWFYIYRHDALNDNLQKKLSVIIFDSVQEKLRQTPEIYFYIVYYS